MRNLGDFGEGRELSIALARELKKKGEEEGVKRFAIRDAAGSSGGDLAGGGWPTPPPVTVAES